jgi:hypothetical protein
MQTKHHPQKSKHHLQPAKSPEKQKKLHHRKDYWPWIVLATIILVTAAIRIQLLSIPLERDEGEFAYMGQLMLQGIPPYLIAYKHEAPRYLCHLRTDYGDIWANDHRNSSGFDGGQLHRYRPFIWADTLFI